MRGLWKKLEQMEERLSRGKRLTLNLLFCTMLLLMIWVRTGYAVPAAEMKFRRLERINLLCRSEIIFNNVEDQGIQWQELPDLNFPSSELVIGVGEDYVHVMRHDLLEIWPLEEGITPVPLYNTSAYFDQSGVTYSGTPLLFLQVPEEAERAEVEINSEDDRGEELRCQGEGWRLAPGRWMFAAYPGDPFTRTWHSGGSYTLRLYREDGSLLLEQSGILNE